MKSSVEGLENGEGLSQKTQQKSKGWKRKASAATPPAIF